jgi:hypothetical protein
MRRTVILPLVMLATLATPTVRADEIGDAIKEATRAYQSGDMPATRTALEEALQFLAQRAADGLAKALPNALSGWTAEDAETNTSSMALLGGGTQASRRYENAAGQDVRIEITADSPMVAQLATLMTNPALAGSMGRLIRIGSHRAIQTSDNQIQMLVDNRVLVAVTGDAPVEAKLSYVRAIDMAKLTARR